MTEARFRSQVEAEAQRLGLLWHACHDSRACRGPKGFPDLVIAGPGGLILAELKTQDGQTTAEQDLWLWTLDHAAMIWRPADLEDNVIESALRRIK